MNWSSPIITIVLNIVIGVVLGILVARKHPATAKKINFLEFLQESNGQLSSARLFALLICLSFIVDYQRVIWTGGQFNPSATVIGVVLGAMGLKVAQKWGEDKPSQNGGTTS